MIAAKRVLAKKMDPNHYKKLNEGNLEMISTYFVTQAARRGKSKVSILYGYLFATLLLITFVIQLER